jgi:ligand-binding SRPBCC domain-containing protein
MFDTKLEQKVQIGAPPERVFEFLTNPERIPVVMPSLVENTDIPPLPLKAGSRFNWKYKMFGVMLQGEWTVKQIDSPTRYVAATTGDTANEWDYTLAASGNGTSLQLAVSYETPKTVLGKLSMAVAQQMNKKEMDTYLSNLKTVLEMPGQ